MEMNKLLDEYGRYTFNDETMNAVVVDVMALVFGLYGEFTIEAKQTFALVFVVEIGRASCRERV